MGGEGEDGREKRGGGKRMGTWGVDRRRGQGRAWGGDRVGHGGGERMGGRREEEGSGWEHGEWTEFDSFEIQFTSTTTIIPVSSL